MREVVVEKRVTATIDGQGRTREILCQGQLDGKGVFRPTRCVGKFFSTPAASAVSVQQKIAA